MIRAMTLGFFALLLVACESKPDTPPVSATPPATPAAKPAVTATAAVPAAVAVPAVAAVDDDLPTEEDFADEVEKDITEANLEAELDKLDKEIVE
jgi:hypothetical protein